MDAITIPENLTLQTLLLYILYVVIIVILPVVVKYGANLAKVWIEAKTGEMSNKYAAQKLERASEIVLQAVSETTQTFVSSLKERGEFTAEAAQEAFVKSRDLAVQMMTSDVVEYINETYNDFNVWLNSKIEQLVLFGNPTFQVPAVELIEEVVDELKEEVKEENP